MIRRNFIYQKAREAHFRRRPAVATRITKRSRTNLLANAVSVFTSLRRTEAEEEGSLRVFRCVRRGTCNRIFRAGNGFF